MGIRLLQGKREPGAFCIICGAYAAAFSGHDAVKLSGVEQIRYARYASGGHPSGRVLHVSRFSVLRGISKHSDAAFRGGPDRWCRRVHYFSEDRAPARKERALIGNGTGISGILEYDGTADGLSGGKGALAAFPLSARNHMGTGRICFRGIHYYIDSGGIRVCLGTGLSGTGDYFFGIERIG